MGLPVTDVPRWLAALALLAGDIEENPGPRKNTTTTNTNTHTCALCTKVIAKNQYALLCNASTPHWLHKACANIKLAQYSTKWTCRNHTQTDQHTQTTLSHTTQQAATAILTHSNSNQAHQQPPNTSNTTSKPAQNTHKKPNTEIKVIQININGITNKLAELTQLIQDQNADIITIQETKLTSAAKTPTIANYTAIRKDRGHNKGGGLLTYIKNDITFTESTIPQNINPLSTEIQILNIHLSQAKQMHIANLYIPPRLSTINQHATEDTDIETCLNYLMTLQNTLITGDSNAHSTTWHSPKNDHRGDLIAGIIQNSNHIILNSDTPTRIPPARNQQSTSPDISTISSNLYSNTMWNTITALSSDHLPIEITIKTKTNFRLTQHRHTYTNYNKANWQDFTDEIEETLTQTAITTNVHLANKILTNTILNADKHHIPKGKIPKNSQLLPDNIRTKINIRDDLRKQNPKDSNIKTLNEEISQLICTHKSNIWRQKLDENWDHKQNTHILWKTIDNLANKKTSAQPNRAITFNNKIHTTPKQIAKAFNKQFINVTKHTTKPQNRKIDKKTKSLKHDHIEITTEQVKEAIKTSKNNNSTGPDNINIKHLKHLGPVAIAYLTELYNISLNTNNIPQIWKLAKIVPILKPQKDAGTGTSFRPISLLSPISKTLEKVILPHITQNIPNQEHQHGFKQKHSTTTALHNINNTIIKGFNEKRPPARTVMVALDMSKAFDTVNIHTLIHKTHQTNIPPTILKFTANYIKGRKAYTTYQNSQSKQQQLKTGVPQGGVLSPTLFNIYMSDIPKPPSGIDLETYADDITTLSTHQDIHTAQTNLQPYLQDIHNWTEENNLKLNPDKSTSTLFTPDPAEYSTQLTLQINNIPIPTVKNPKILGLTFDPKLNYGEHIKIAQEKANKTTNILKALTSTKWGKQKETITTTYKTICRPILEYASTVWSPIVSNTNINKLQTTQNTALRIATGCTADTNAQHLHEETHVLPVQEHLKLHASLLHQKAQHPDHPLHKLTQQQAPPRNMKESMFRQGNPYINHIQTDSATVTEDNIKQNITTLHTSSVQNYLTTRNNNKIINQQAPDINKAEETLPRQARRRLAQLRTGKCPLLQTYKHKIDPLTHNSPLCPLCKNTEHTTQHLFTCTHINTQLTPLDLWRDPVGAAGLLATWELELDGH
ncbi:MAG: reverse transcriptase domain-containing protein [Immundisolibacter sp.]|uniref:reverse transcriptase domain-containing protein n=1 Tax=Immundisolibacter sp. TaxID=1934948 RepID=UPI003EE27492